MHNECATGAASAGQSAGAPHAGSQTGGAARLCGERAVGKMRMERASVYIDPAMDRGRAMRRPAVGGGTPLGAATPLSAGAAGSSGSCARAQQRRVFWLRTARLQRMGRGGTVQSAHGLSAQAALGFDTPGQQWREGQAASDLACSCPQLQGALLRDTRCQDGESL